MMKSEELCIVTYNAFLVNTFEREKGQKCKFSTNLENIYKAEVNTTIYDSIYSSTRILSKHKINDQCIVNDQIDAHGYGWAV